MRHTKEFVAGIHLYFLLTALVVAGNVLVIAQANYLKESEEKAKAILAKTVEAMGGEAFKNVGDMSVTGRLYDFRKDVLAGTTLFQNHIKFPDKVRYEIGKKKEIVMINDGDKGWKVEYKNVSEQTEEEVKVFRANLKHNLDYLLRFGINREGMKFRYMGRIHVDVDEIEEVQLIDKEEDRVKLMINASTYLPVKMEFQSPSMGKRWASDDERQYFNYHIVQGVQFPYSTVRFSNGFKVSEVQLDSVRTNSNLPDAMFTPGYKK
jgi:hypothetical protein